jgi:hypothetical protein
MALGKLVAWPVPDADALLADWPSTRLYRAPSRTGTFAAIAVVPLVAGTTASSYQDTTALDSDWYRWTYYSAGTGAETAPGPAFPAAGSLLVSLQTLRRTLARAVGLYGHYEGDFAWPGPSLTTAAGTTAAQLVDPGYADSWYRSDQFQGWYAAANDAPVAGQERRISAFDRATGTFTAARAFGTNPGIGVTVDLYGELGRQDWNDALFGAEGVYLQYWEPFQWPLAGVAGQTEYALPWWIENETQVLGIDVVTRGQTSGLFVHSYVPGVHFRVLPLETGGVRLVDVPGLGPNTVWSVRGYRHPVPLAADTDTMALTELGQRLLLKGGAVKVLQKLTQRFGAEAEDVSAWGQQLSRALIEFDNLQERNNAWREGRPPRSGRRVAIGGRSSGRYGGFYS